jgi:hypothetical protein
MHLPGTPVLEVIHKSGGPDLGHIKETIDTYTRYYNENPGGNFPGNYAPDGGFFIVSTVYQAGSSSRKGNVSPATSSAGQKQNQLGHSRDSSEAYRPGAAPGTQNPGIPGVPEGIKRYHDVNGRYKGHPTEKQRAIKGGQKSTVQVVDGGKEYNLTKSEAYYRENDETKSKCGFKYFRYEILDKSSDLYREGVWVGQGFQYRPQNSPAVSPHAGERMSEHVPEHTQLHGELPVQRDRKRRRDSVAQAPSMTDAGSEVVDAIIVPAGGVRRDSILGSSSSESSARPPSRERRDAVDVLASGERRDAKRACVPSVEDRTGFTKILHRAWDELLAGFSYVDEREKARLQAVVHEAEKVLLQGVDELVALRTGGQTEDLQASDALNVSEFLAEEKIGRRDEGGV